MCVQTRHLVCRRWEGTRYRKRAWCWCGGEMVFLGRDCPIAQRPPLSAISPEKVRPGRKPSMQHVPTFTRVPLLSRLVELWLCMSALMHPAWSWSLHSSSSIADDIHPWHTIADSFRTAHDGSLQLCDFSGLDGAVGARANVGSIVETRCESC